MKRMIVFCALALSASAGEKPVLQPKVCPTPARAEIATADYVPLKTVAFSCGDAAAAEWVRRHLDDWYGPHAPNLTTGDETCPTEAEAYRLSANASGVRISAGSLVGARWALQTLRQLAIPAREILSEHGNELVYADPKTDEIRRRKTRPGERIVIY